ncbi:MAG TPA: histidine phosphatase family protein [Candidatus Edwardsbacteria bacterium]|nr:histidine phosphatase family protein [Candidatus Edwardsbacteria bacterium]
MDLYFLRNANTLESGEDGTKHDDDTSLSKKGERKMLRIAQGMKDLELEFDAIIASPLLRTTQSAEIVADVFRKKKHLRFSPHLAPRGNSAVLIREIARDHHEAKALLLVGHETSMSALISMLLVGDDSLQIIFKRGGLCKLTAERLEYGKCAQLCWLMAPSQLKRL